MSDYILRRLLGVVPLLLGITLVTFLIIHATPGSPVDNLKLNPEIKAEDLQSIMRTLDKDQRKHLYLDAQNQILADAPALIIDFPKDIWGVSNRVKNFIPNAVSFAATWNAYQWFVTDGK